MKITPFSLPVAFSGGLLLLLSPPEASPFMFLPPTPVPSADTQSIILDREVPHASSNAVSLSEHLSTWLVSSEVSKPSTSVSQQASIAATPEQVKLVLGDPRTVLLDARRDDEIIDEGFISVKGHQWVHASCTKDDCPLLLKTAESQLPDKSAPVVVYCGTGKRAAQAKRTLERKGYRTVVNAGAYPDLDYLKQL